MTRKDNTRHAPAAAGQLHSPRLPRPTATREHRASLQQERSLQGKPMNAPWSNAKTHRLFQVPERGCSPGQRLSLHRAQTPPHTPRARQPAQVAMQVTGGPRRRYAHLTGPRPPASILHEGPSDRKSVV